MDAVNMREALNAVKVPCGDRFGSWACTLPAGEHPGWKHLNETANLWWAQLTRPSED